MKTKILRWVVTAATHIGVPTDKLLHFVCAMVLMIVTSMLTSPMIGYGVTMAICIGKEIYDVYKPNPTGFSIDDLLADLLGMLMVGMVVEAVCCML